MGTFTECLWKLTKLREIINQIITVWNLNNQEYLTNSVEPITMFVYNIIQVENPASRGSENILLMLVISYFILRQPEFTQTSS